MVLSFALGAGLLALGAHAAWSPQGDDASPRERALALGLGLALPLALALPSLGWSSLEHLEASYLFEAVKPASLWELIGGRQAAEQMHQPLFPLVLRGWAQVAGTGEAAIRLPSALFAALAVPVVWRFARGWLPPLGAAAAALAFAVSPLLVWYAKDCSPYALFALLGAVALRWASVLVRTPDAPRRAGFLAGVALALAFYTHFAGAWLAVFVGGWLLLERRFAPLRRLVLVVGALCLPALGLLLDKLVTSVQGLTEDQPIMRFSHALTEAIPEALRIFVGGEHWAWTAVLLVAATGARGPLRRLAVAAALAMVVSEAHILWQLQRSKGIVYVDIRHYIAWLPVLALLVGRLRPALAAVAVAAILTTSVPMVTGALRKPDAREAFAWLRQHALAPANAVTVLPAPWYSAISEYYLLGVCPDLVHARSFEGWWEPGTCALDEAPRPGTVYGFPFGTDRVWLSRLRRGLTTLWVVDLRDHRFGLPVAPTTVQEDFEAWAPTPLGEVRFGDWVTIRRYAFAALPVPPAPRVRPIEMRTMRP